MERNYQITNFLCDQTYGGVYAFSDFKELNQRVKHYSLKTLEKHYGTGRAYYSEIPDDYDYGFKPYMFIAWLSNDNEGEEVDEAGDEFHGKDLFVIGFTDKPETCVQDIYRMGDEYFKEYSRGFYF
jgi:hypothetical protein